ncbi:PRC-barrel domain containing protein [Sphingomonas sp. R86520]|uniref:PRC-barrel domain containing protein n=1 Tax=Sphingomonas sp. R86520 TaxID=3093859 RepID=UPI0036D31ED7
MVDIAGWIALVATCVAALMTASNLGARVTGWGFVIFTGGALAWIVVGFITGQTQLLYSNLFLAAVDIFGIWRWLGRRARISDASRAEEKLSARQPGDDLFSVAGLDGLPVKSQDGVVVAHAVDALAACIEGRIGYLIVRVGGVGGVGETLHRLPWAEVTVTDGEVRTDLAAAAIARLPEAAAR